MLSTQFLLTALVVVIAPGTGVIYILAAARNRLLGSARVMRWLNRGFAAIFAGLGLRLAFARA